MTHDESKEQEERDRMGNRRGGDHKIQTLHMRLRTPREAESNEDIRNRTHPQSNMYLISYKHNKP